jgi:hypothetical protein
VERCLERIGEHDPDGEMFLHDLWEETEMVLDVIKSGCEVKLRRPQSKK